MMQSYFYKFFLFNNLPNNFFQSLVPYKGSLTLERSRDCNYTATAVPTKCSVATLHVALICFTEHTLKLTKHIALLRSATYKCERGLNRSFLILFKVTYSSFFREVCYRFTGQKNVLKSKKSKHLKVKASSKKCLSKEFLLRVSEKDPNHDC